MAIEAETHLLPGGRVMALSGPMRLVISAFLGQVPQPAEAKRAAVEAFGYLAGVASHRRGLSRPLEECGEMADPLAMEMIAAAGAIGDPTLTPMAAVAGAIADAVADFLFARGLTRVIVDNGGDVAIRLREGESARVGLRLAAAQPEWSHVLRLGSEEPRWGVCTSGLSGRSLTRGVASIATVVADRASRADAAATAVANASFVDHPAVERRLAEDIDPDSDIRGLPVTVRVGRLPEPLVDIAINQGLAKARALEAAGVIKGTLIAVQGRLGLTAFMESRIENV